MTGTPKSRKFHVIELNEFNLELLSKAAQTFNLTAVRRVLSWQSGTTMADQDVEHQGLDPWVQWVSIHAETPSQCHGVIRLGDVPKLQIPQVWERLSEQAFSTGVWGVMNGSRGSSKLTQFFFADPWTFSNEPYPAELAKFLALPAYYAKNYLALERGKLLAAAVTTAGFVLRHVSPLNLVRDGWFLLKNFWRAPSDSCSLFSAFELISARLFRKYRDRYQPDVTFAFFNLIAHFQHHHWESGGSDWRHEAVFRTADRILSLALTKLQADDVVLVLNGLSQRNVRDEGLFCYRQIDPARFLRRAGIRFARVEQLMTNDAHVFFDNESDRAEAARKLGLARIGGEPAFFVELDKADPSKLFYQVSYWDEAESDAMLEVDGSRYPFFSEFAVHAQRTGAHVREGTYFINQPILPALVENSKVLSYLWPVPHAQ